MKIAVLVSGGVDSSVALALLKEQGHDVTAFYLKIWLEDELSFLGNCPWEEDLSFVRGVCDTLQVPLQIVPMQKPYWDTVVSYVISEVKAGRTPNPDMLCNQYVKFGFFLDAIDSSFEKVATGHYAQVREENGRFHLYQAPDPVKDQTYFLARLSQKQLSRAFFPIGHLTKKEVRALAQQFNLPTKDRKDSQGICFLGKIKFREFLAHHLGTRSGEIVEYETGNVLGTHQGFWYYTIGQRQGLKLGGGPWYVVAKDGALNKVYISKNYYDADKKRDQFFIIDMNWIGKTIENEAELFVKLRHGPDKHQCHIKREGEKWHVFLKDRDQGIAAGQFAVFYDQDECLGGGVIETFQEDKIDTQKMLIHNRS